MPVGIYQHKKGWKHTEETKRKIGKAHKGMKHTEAAKRKISEACRGRRHSEETKRKMSMVLKRNPRKPWLGKYGKNNPNWKGGKCTRRDERSDSLYQYWARAVKKRDDWTCRINNKDCSGYCIAHHILPWSDYPELRYDMNNGITLCQAHHPKKRAEEDELIPIFQKLVSRRNDFESNNKII